MALHRSTPRTRAFGLLAVAALAALPWVAQALGQEFYIGFAARMLALAGLSRLTGSRFGRVIQAIRENESRMEAIGYPVFRYKLACFVLGGAVAGLAGALMANHTGLASPNYLSWMQSGMLMVMVILGGAGSPWGGFVGAALLLLVEEILSGLTIHHQLGVGIALLANVLWAPRGRPVGAERRWLKRRCSKSSASPNTSAVCTRSLTCGWAYLTARFTPSSGPTAPARLP